MASTWSTPGLNSARLLKQATTAIERCALELRGCNVLTEAATGPFIVTPIIAAMAGANVTAMTRATPFGTVEHVRNTTLDLADLAGISNRIRVVDTLSNEAIGQADIVTNSGHVRPINAAMVAALKSGAVIPLMYESWEFRKSDIDLEACAARGISVAGTNERHPAIDVFSFLGMMAIKLLVDAGIPVYKSSILLLCDNPFAEFIEATLQSAGAQLTRASKLSTSQGARFDAILVALRPCGRPALDESDVKTIKRDFEGAVVLQFWGDIDRHQLSAAGIPFWPLSTVAPGHMGILPSAIGPDPVIRLQCGGLKVGEIMAAAARRGLNPVEAAVASGFGQELTAHQDGIPNHATV